MSSESLKTKAKKGLFWSSVERFSNQGVQFVFSIILARILSPSDYGIIAMLAIFFAVAQSFIDSGFSNALIRKPDCNEKDKATAFYFNVIVGFIAYIVFFIISPYVAKFYSQPILSPILRISALSVFLNSLCIVQQAELTKNLDFKQQAKITLVCTIVTGLLSIYMAYTGWGVWALVFQGVASQLLRVILFWLMVRWRPQEPFSKESFRYLFGYGSKLLASGLIDTIYNNLYPLIIGKLFTASQLGFFSRAQSLAALPATNITGVLQRVTFPLLSQMQNDMEYLRRNYRRILRLSAFVIFPIMVFLAANAKPLIRILLTEKWDGAIVYFQVLCLGMILHPIHAINLNLLQVKGRSDLFLRLEIIKKIIGITIMCMTISIGILAMCIGLVVSSAICLLVNMYYTGKIINLGYLLQLKDIIPIILNSIIMGGLIIFSISFLDQNWMQLLIGTTFGISYYFLSSRIINRNEWEDMRTFLQGK